MMQYPRVRDEEDVNGCFQLPYDEMAYECVMLFDDEVKGGELNEGMGREILGKLKIENLSTSAGLKNQDVFGMNDIHGLGNVRKQKTWDLILKMAGKIFVVSSKN